MENDSPVGGLMGGSETWLSWSSSEWRSTFKRTPLDSPQTLFWRDACRRARLDLDLDCGAVVLGSGEEGRVGMGEVDSRRQRLREMCGI
jgi:hypothetical protein